MKINKMMKRFHEGLGGGKLLCIVYHKDLFFLENVWMVFCILIPGTLPKTIYRKAGSVRGNWSIVVDLTN